MRLEKGTNKQVKTLAKNLNTFVNEIYSQAVKDFLEKHKNLLQKAGKKNDKINTDNHNNQPGNNKHENSKKK